MMNRRDLANDIWRACDIMRRDDGTTGVLEYMEQLSWLIFLKVFEDIEKRLEDEANFAGGEYQPIIESKYRWSSWARKDWGPGKQDEKHPLIKFIDDELFPYLRALTGSPEKEKISMIFREITGNRMKSPYNLKDVIDLIDGINFNDVEDSHVLSQVYEELLLRLGREGGVAGEFYTPRPIVRLMVKIVDPKIHETVFDPFCGSCGFLAESYGRMMRSKNITVEEYEKLQKETFYAQEKKPLPYLIGVMNCILHGLLTPNVIRKNTLEDNIRNIPEARRHNVILTNPPFGGKEGRQIQQNFPVQSQATELLALQYVMKSLKRDGRCGIVLPEGVLFRGDAFAQVKKELLENFNLHTIVSLPSGVFANVTSSGQGPKTNLLFFDRTGPTKEIWYYEHNSPEGKKYTKANPITDEDLADCYEKWKNREISENSWIVPVEEVVKRGYDLTAKNPNKKEDDEHRPPEELVTSALEKERQILKILEEVQDVLGESRDKEVSLDVFMRKDALEESSEEMEISPELPKGWKLVKLGNLAEFVTSGATPTVSDATLYSDEKNGIPFFRIQNISENGLIFSDLKYITLDVHNTLLKRSQVKPGDVLVTITGRLGTATCVHPKIKNANINQHICLIRLNQRIVEPRYVAYHLNSEFSHEEMMRKQAGATRIALNHRTIRSLSIKLPPLKEQKRIVAKIEEILSRVEQARKLREEALKEVKAVMQSALHEVFSKAEEQWGSRTLNEVCEINPPKKEIRGLFDDTEVTFVPMNAVSEVTGRIEDPSTRLLKEVKKGYTYFKEGDVLFAKITPCMENGKSAIARNLVNGLGFGSTEFHVIRPSNEIIAEWIYYFIRQESFRELAAKNMTGSVGQQRVPEGFLESVRIPLPPVEEQKRIVEYLDQLQEKVEVIKKHQEETKEEIEAITQAVLKKAFGGAL